MAIGSERKEDRVEENIQTMEKNSFALAKDGGEGSLGNEGNWRKENLKNMDMCDVTGHEENQSVKNQSGWDYSAQMEHNTM